MNELIFILQTFCMAGVALLALKAGREALCTFTALACVMANIFVLKQISLFSLNATAADSFAIAAIFSLNLLNEYFGTAATRKALWIAFASAAFVAFIAQLHLAFVPNAFDYSQAHYEALFLISPRIIAASLIAYAISQATEYGLYTHLKRLSGGNYLVARNWLSMATSQLLDTVIFSFLALYGLVHSLGSIIIVSYTIKLLTIFLLSPFIWISKKVIKQPL